jgi:hypothetical protein
MNISHCTGGGGGGGGDKVVQMLHRHSCEPTAQLLEAGSVTAAGLAIKGWSVKHDWLQ